jgi:hypothetical protein
MSLFLIFSNELNIPSGERLVCSVFKEPNKNAEGGLGMLAHSVITEIGRLEVKANSSKKLARLESQQTSWVW